MNVIKNKHCTRKKFAHLAFINKKKSRESFHVVKITGKQNYVFKFFLLCKYNIKSCELHKFLINVYKHFFLLIHYHKEENTYVHVAHSQTAQ